MREHAQRCYLQCCRRIKRGRLKGGATVTSSAGNVQPAVADTNLLHRGGLAGLRFAQRAARLFLEEGGVGRRDWRERALAVHRAFVARRLSPGGSADLLAMSLFVQACEAEG